MKTNRKNTNFLNIKRTLKNNKKKQITKINMVNIR